MTQTKLCQNMAESNVILSGPLKYRDGKKWKPRLGILKKLSPVADRLHLSLYKDSCDYARHHDIEKHKIPLENFLGIDSGFALDKEQHVMAIVCQNAVILVAFQAREVLIGWELTVRKNLGQERQFPATLLKTPLTSGVPLGPCKLYIQGQMLCLTSSPVPHILATWHIAELRRFGLIDGHFCFEAGSCSGVYGLQCSHSDEISHLLEQAALGKTPKNKRAASRRPLLSESSKGSLASVAASRGDTTASDGLVYVDLVLVEEENEHATPCVTDSTQTSTTSSGEKQKLVSIDDARRERFCDIYNVLPRQVVKVQSFGQDCHTSLSQLASRRYSCGDIDNSAGASKHDNRCNSVRDTNRLLPPPHNAPVPSRSQRIRRPSYPRPLGAATAEVHSRSDTNMSEIFTTVQSNGDELSPKLRKCDGLPNPIITENQVYESSSQNSVGVTNGDETTRRGKENCEPQSVTRTPPLPAKKYAVSVAGVEKAVDMHKPLHYVESRDLDGIMDDGYLYWPQTDGQLPPRPPVSEHAQSSSYRTNRHYDNTSKTNPAYMNLGPPGLLACSDKGDSIRKCTTEHVKRSTSDSSRRSSQQRGTFLSLHGSLKRSRSNASRSLLSARPPAPNENDPYGAYVMLKTDSPLSRPRGRSLEDVLESDYMQSPQLPNKSSQLLLAPGLSQASSKGQRTTAYPALPPKQVVGQSTSDTEYIHMQPSSGGSTNSQANTEISYMKMNVTRQPLASRHGSLMCKPSAKLTVKPTLQHSRSLDDELDSPHGDADEYLDMNSNGLAIQRPSKTTLRCVKSSNSLLQSSPSQLQKPFDNLLPHKHHSSRRPVPSGKSDSEDKPGSAGSSASSSSGKGSGSRTPSLFSRIIRRNSHSKTNGKETPPDEGSSSAASSRRSSIDLLTDTPAPANVGTLRPRSRHADMYADRSSLVTQLSELDRASLDSLPTEPAPPPPPQMVTRPSSILPKPSSVPPPPSMTTMNSSFVNCVPNANDKPTLFPRCKVQYINTDPDPEDLEWAMQQAPALPEKTYTGSTSRHTDSITSSMQGGLRGLTSSRNEMLDDVFYENQDGFERSRRASERIPQRRGQPSLTVTIPHPAGSQTPIPGAIPVIVADRDEDEIWPDGRNRHRLVSHQSQASLISCTSTETCTTPVVVEDQKTSPALTTLRPRSGKEYQRLDRRKITTEVEESNPLLSQPPSALESRLNAAQSPNSVNAFSFDLGSNYSRKSVSSVWSSGEDSPKHPNSVCSRQPSFREPIYMNLNFAKNDSLIIMEGTPPSSPGPRSLSRLSEVQLNYAEIDLTETENSSRRRRPRATPTEYAMIDMIATAAASRVGREHARLREDSLLRKESQRLADGRPPQAGHRGSSIEKKGSLSRHSSVTSRDR